MLSATSHGSAWVSRQPFISNKYKVVAHFIGWLVLGRFLHDPTLYSLNSLNVTTQLPDCMQGSLHIIVNFLKYYIIFCLHCYNVLCSLSLFQNFICQLRYSLVWSSSFTKESCKLLNTKCNENPSFIFLYWYLFAFLRLVRHITLKMGNT